MEWFLAKWMRVKRVIVLLGTHGSSMSCWRITLPISKSFVTLSPRVVPASSGQINFGTPPPPTTHLEVYGGVLFAVVTVAERLDGCLQLHSPKCCCAASLLIKEVSPHDPVALWTAFIGLRFQSESSSSCVCWPTAASTALHLITSLRPSVQSLAVAHVITSDLLRCQPYWCRPHVVRLLETGHSRWLPHGHRMPYRNMFGTRLLFPFSTENWRLFCSGRRSLMWSDNELCFVSRPSLNAVMSPSTGCYKPFLLILYSGLAAAMWYATLIIFIFTITTTTTTRLWW